MSKKVLQYAGQRRTLLAIIMATVTIGLLFSGWLTRLKADNGGSDPQVTVESVTTNCMSEGSITLDAPTNSPIGCIGSSISVSPLFEFVPANVTIVTSNSDGSVSITTNTPNPAYLVTWTASVGDYSINGTNLPATFTPTNSGSGTVSFTCNYTNNTPCTDIGSSTTSGSFIVDAVTDLTPSAGQWVDDGDSDPDTATYLVQYGCNSTIIVTASDCAGLSASNLPDCWTPSLTGTATQIDKMHFSIDGNTAVASTVTITCGTSTKTVTIIVYQAKFEIFTDEGDCGYDVGHSWWKLEIQPSDVNPFLKQGDGTDVSGSGPQGLGGYWPYYLRPDPRALYGPGVVNYGNQGHAATAYYWWCISFDHYISALTYVNILTLYPGIYDITSNNCTTQPEAIAGVVGAPISYSGITPCGLDSYLSDWTIIHGWPYCYCQ